MGGEERQRLTGTDLRWKTWGPYLSERAWGTVREDFSEHGDAWDHLSHDDARSRTFRWSEDGLGGICDASQILCLAFAFWNGADPILKERIFGLTGNQGNHGEDAKEYWWYLDSTPTHSWMRWRYRYPQAAFPYQDLIDENRRRGKQAPEYELVDTAVFDGDRYFDVTADYAKASPDEIHVRLRIRNAGPDEARIDVLPTLWFRNTWSWDGRAGVDGHRPAISSAEGGLVAQHPTLGRMVLNGDGAPQPLFCDNESNARRLWGVEGSTPYPKDGIGDHVVAGSPTVNPDGTGTKASLWYRLRLGPGHTEEIRLV
ncbi:MAG TPA: hypothetical protein VG365_00645, partial [Solirubrobacteraceae bacterium]|nr:hypothetical protein [Solirubrobacteraceae bacterium]